MAAKIIVACGSGVATSQTVAKKVNKLLEDRGIKADVEAVDIRSLKHYIKNADAYIAVARAEEDYDVPVFNGVAFLTGMGQDEELDKLIEVIENK